MAVERYTQVARATLWLVPDGELEVDGNWVDVAPFYISRTLITNAHFAEFDPAHERTPLTPGDDDPALGVTWAQADAYCRWYAELAKKPFRLPTAREWEYACRGGSESRYFWGDDAGRADVYAVDSQAFDGTLPPLESHKPNKYGLHDMLGTAWEWTADKSARGGSYRVHRSELGCAVVHRPDPEVAHADLGFRIVRSLR